MKKIEEEMKKKNKRIDKCRKENGKEKGKYVLRYMI